MGSAGDPGGVGTGMQFWTSISISLKYDLRCTNTSRSLKNDARCNQAICSLSKIYAKQPYGAQAICACKMHHRKKEVKKKKKKKKKMKLKLKLEFS